MVSTSSEVAIEGPNKMGKSNKDVTGTGTEHTNLVKVMYPFSLSPEVGCF